MNGSRLQRLLIIVLVIVATVFLVVLALLLWGPEAPTSAPVAIPEAGPTASPPQADHHPDPEAMYLPQDLIFTSLSGTRLALSDLDGSVKAFYFFTSYCPYCKQALESATAFARAVEDAGDAAFYLVDRLDGERETRRDGIAYYQAHDFPFDLLFDDEREMFDRLGLSIVPTALFFNAENRLMSYVTGNHLTPQVLRAHLAYAQEGGEAQTLEAVRTLLMGADGSIASRYDTNPREVLCESQGLMMEYAVGAGDQALFAQSYAYIDALASEVGLLPWRVEDETPATLNATLDDLRVLGALLDAEEAWGGYQQQADGLAEALLLRCAPLRQLCDYYDWSEDQAATTLSLCYVDVRTLGRLAEERTAWRAVYDNAVALLRGGYIGDDFPLYYPRYDYAASGYAGEELHMAEAALTLLQLARLGGLPETTVDFLLERLRSDGLYARYRTDGSVVEGYGHESTAVYALLVLVARELQDEEMERLALGHMEQLRVWDAGTPFCGAYGAKTGDALYAFDQMTALLAWQTILTDSR